MLFPFNSSSLNARLLFPVGTRWDDISMIRTMSVWQGFQNSKYQRYYRVDGTGMEGSARLLRKTTDQNIVCTYNGASFYDNTFMRIDLHPKCADVLDISPITTIVPNWTQHTYLLSLHHITRVTFWIWVQNSYNT